MNELINMFKMKNLPKEVSLFIFEISYPNHNFFLDSIKSIGVNIEMGYKIRKR